MTNADIKLAKSLNQSKFRKEHQAYIIEGIKLVNEWLRQADNIKWIICTEEHYAVHLDDYKSHRDILHIVPYHVLEKISSMSTPPPVMAVVNMPKNDLLPTINPHQKWHLVLDRIQDPGNLGTIIRLADWLGMSEIIISPQSVDIYNPKVIQSTMGSFLRVKVIEMSLQVVINQAQKLTIGTILGGESLLEFEKTAPEKGGYLFIGNESHGLPEEIIRQMDRNVTLPSHNSAAESLNVAIATSMICSRLMYS